MGEQSCAPKRGREMDTELRKVAGAGGEGMFPLHHLTKQCLSFIVQKFAILSFLHPRCPWRINTELRY